MKTIDSPLSPSFFGAISLVKRFNQEGYEAYLVGGCVRDLLLGREVTDYDIATSALPEEIQELFPKNIPTGIKWGTITVVWDAYCYEVTTFRGEGTYSDGRRPDAVVYGVSLEEDLKRRDFTINAMAYHPRHGIIDPYGGEIDLECKILRTVGVPHQRFSEDYLRILRGLRFSATLGFPIESETADGIHSTWEGLHQVTRERITAEIRKLVMGNHLHLLTEFYPVLEEGVFYGIDCLWEAEDVYQLRDKLQGISEAPYLLTLRLAMFLSLFYPDSAILKLSKQEAAEVDFLCETTCLVWDEDWDHWDGSEAVEPDSEKHFLDMVHLHGREKMNLLLFFQKYHYPYHTAQLVELQEGLKQQNCTSLKELNLTGQDLLDVGVVAGETVGKLLHIALDLVLTGAVANKKEDLLTVMFGDKNKMPT